MCGIEVVGIFWLLAVQGALAGISARIPCKSENDCKLVLGSDRNMNCKANTCFCDGEGDAQPCTYDALVQMVRTTVAPLVNRVCKENGDCSLKNGSCNRKTYQCECNEGFVAANNDKQCVEKSKGLGASCEWDEQCSAVVEGSSCEEKQCRCGKGYRKAAGNTCLKTIDFKGACQRDEDCSHIEGAKCLASSTATGSNPGVKSCECGEMTAINDEQTKCLKLAAAMGHECRESVQCSGLKDAECFQDKCQCKISHHYVASRAECFPNRALNETCKSEEDSCFQPTGLDRTRNALLCSKKSGRCECAKSYKQTNDKCESSGAFAPRSIYLWALILMLIAVVLSN